MCDPNLTLGQVEGFVSSHFWQFLKLGLCKQQVTCPPLALNASTLQNPFTMDLEAGSSSLTPKHSDASNLGHIGVSWPEFSEDETRTSQAKQLWLPCLKGSCISMAWKYVSIIVFQGGDLSSLVKWFFEQRDEHVSKKAASFCTCLCCCWRCMECVLLTVTKKHLCWSWFRISENWRFRMFPWPSCSKSSSSALSRKTCRHRFLFAASSGLLARRQQKMRPQGIDRYLWRSKWQRLHAGSIAGSCLVLH